MVEPGLKKLGRYEIVRELGRGAMGVVYEGHDPVVDRRVAIKTARRDILEGNTRVDELMERFLREARAAGALSHPNIVTIYDAGEENGTAYIAMEYLDGTDLQKLLDQNRRFTVEQVLEITSTLCGALGHAHAHGVVHRDIKPSNVVLLDSGLIKVADFGIARVSDSHLTQEGSVIGTPHYMSPEQFMGHPVDARSDLFSAGVIIYEMLTGEKPFHGNSLSAVMHNVLNVTPVPPRQLNFAVTECLSRVVLKALSKAPARRYQSADEMCMALKECLKDEPDPVVTKVGTPSETLGLSETVAAVASAQTVVTASPDAATRIMQRTEAPAPAAPVVSMPASSHAAGRAIRARREERELILDKAAHEARVSERYVMAIEAGDVRAFEEDEWPKVEGLLRAYCESLDLDPALFIPPFEAAFNKVHEPRKPVLPRRWVLGGAAGFVALMLGVIGAFLMGGPTDTVKGAGATPAPVSAESVQFLMPGQKPPADYYQMIPLRMELIDGSDGGSFNVTVQQKTGTDQWRTIATRQLPTDSAVVLLDRFIPAILVDKEGYEGSEQRAIQSPKESGSRDLNPIEIALSPIIK